MFSDPSLIRPKLYTSRRRRNTERARNTQLSHTASHTARFRSSALKHFALNSPWFQLFEESDRNGCRGLRGVGRELFSGSRYEGSVGGVHQKKNPACSRRVYQVISTGPIDDYYKRFPETGQARDHLIPAQGSAVHHGARPQDSDQGQQSEPVLFRCGGKLVWVESDDHGRPVLREITQDKMRLLLARRYQWYRVEQT